MAGKVGDVAALKPAGGFNREKLKIAAEEWNDRSAFYLFLLPASNASDKEILDYILECSQARAKQALSNAFTLKMLDDVSFRPVPLNEIPDSYKTEAGTELRAGYGMYEEWIKYKGEEYRVNNVTITFEPDEDGSRVVEGIVVPREVQVSFPSEKWLADEGEVVVTAGSKKYGDSWSLTFFKKCYNENSEVVYYDVNDEVFKTSCF